MAEQVAAGNAESSALIAMVREHKASEDAQKAEIRAVESEIDEIRGEKFEPLEAARKGYNKVADELLFLSKRLDQLDGKNQEVKLAEGAEKLAAAKTALEESTTGKKALSNAKKVVRQEDSIERLEGQLMLQR